ncbi:MAG: T9SS type A sorting domain-containing protein, partial [Flavobacterium sp.]
SPAGGTWSGDHVSASGLFDASGLAAGPYNVTYTYSDANQCTNSDVAVVTVNALPVLECPDNSMDNVVQCGVSVSAAQASTNSSFNEWFSSFATLNSDPDFEVTNVTYVYTPLNAEPAEGHAPLNPTLGVDGVVETSVLVTWTVQDENGCISSCSASFGLSYNCNLTCEASVTPVLCNGDDSGSIRVISGGSTPPYTLVISGSNLQNPIIKVFQSDFDDVTSGLLAGIYEYLVTDAVGATCNTGSPLEISQPDALSLSLEMEPENCADSATGSIEAVFSGGTPPYSVSIDDGVASEQSSPYTFEGLSTGNHIVKIVDANGCEISDEINIELISCDEAHCTYTQGFYGNYGGLGCTPDLGTVNSHVMMTSALTQVGGSYNFGSMLTGNYFLLKLSDVTGAANPRDNKIYKMLPGGGSPRSLIGFATFDDYSTWSDNNPLTASGPKKGAINNNLLSQTMVLFFNMQIDHSLASFELESTFATAAIIQCGSDIPNMESVQVFYIPQRVIDYLNLNGGATVNNLFVLANKALGGESINGVSHSNINAAVDAINRGFDKCRIQVAVPEDINVQVVNYEIGANDLSVKAYPNPFKDYIDLNYQFNYDSDVEIQIFDTKGTLLYNFKDTDAYFGKEVRIDASFNRGKGELFIIKLVTDKETVIKKVISSNY